MVVPSDAGASLSLARSTTCEDKGSLVASDGRELNAARRTHALRCNHRSAVRCAPVT
ncbi:Uncharacterised protein [Mycobacteroides abscessus subsp. abscessus]|nr:Uncharacterised protein [Mycobacteroides abscessus subsp. abscessus]